MAQFVNTLRKFEDFMQLGGVSNDEIKKAEERLGVRFAEEYKEYLRECGAATADGHEYTGICKAKRLDVVLVTEKERSAELEISDSAYVVEQTHMDGIVIWQTTDEAIYQSHENSFKKINNSLAEYVG